MLFFAALLADAYIYRSLIVRHFRRLPARATYLLFAIVTDGAALTALMLYGAASDRGSAGVVTVMWLVWLFFLTLLPKLLYTLGGVADALTRLATRRRSVIFRALASALGVVMMVVMVCGATTGRTKTRVTEVEICSDRVPEAFDGYRIAQISDVHLGTMLNAERQTGRLVEKINSLGADMVVNTGDLVNLTNDELTPELTEILSRLAPPDGVWSVWGNHDLGFYIRNGAELTPEENFRRLAEKVRGAGWRVLSDSSTWITRGGDSILLTGVDYPSSGRHNGHNSALAGADLDAAFAEATSAKAAGHDPFNIVLAHTPLLWNDITERGGGDLTLSGHTHSMQTKLNLLGYKWSPARQMYAHWSGRYEKPANEKNAKTSAEAEQQQIEKKDQENDKKPVLYINDGIGCVGYPMRIGARGEITLFTLKKRCE
jgi:predicted MPP superfamily phosphohydrolase